MTLMAAFFFSCSPNVHMYHTYLYICRLVPICEELLETKSLKKYMLLEKLQDEKKQQMNLEEK